MVVPLINSRVEQSHHLSIRRINAGKIGTFVKIAAVTRKCEIPWIIIASMFDSDDVLYVK